MRRMAAQPIGIDGFLGDSRVAYFSMEIALRSEIPTYAGGLGVLAGDTLRTAADLRLPMVGVTLVSRAGHFRQELNASGGQIEHPAPWDPARWAAPLDAKAAVRIAGRSVWVAGWLYVIESPLGGLAPVILLDTDQPENASTDREITHRLYGDGEEYRLAQEMVLGLGGVRILHALGFRISEYHMNEGHSSLLGLELLRRNAYRPEDVRPGEPAYDLPRVRRRCRFTTHTPVEAGHDRFSYDLVGRLFAGKSPPLDLALLRELGGADVLNMTRLALNLSDFVNGVAKRHAEVSRGMFPGYEVRSITNGVHPCTWTAQSFRALYDRYVPGWSVEPELLVRADAIPADALAAAHASAKSALIERVRTLTGVGLDAAKPILGFARRMTAYKRPDLLFSDMDRLRRIAAGAPFQIVLGGKAHPHDAQGKRLIALLHDHARALAGSVPVAYLPDYDLGLAQLVVAGADVWLNTPLPPFEASGTSGMKAAFNGVPSLSVPDGWWIEGCIEGVTGWSVDDAASLYEKLERIVLPLYYTRTANPGGWIGVMQGAITKNAAYFNSQRMMRRYATEAYLH
ncbi:MAG TPA: alpha-glucan family phosphorylase [Steroidobacteraceae bacterium]|nr:alpha-glucan family phosphorylase [Steroidobacteraceae bacterium]